MALYGEHVLVYLLKNSTAVWRTGVKDKIFAIDSVPQEEQEPYIVHQRIGGEHRHRMDGSGGFVTYSIQLNIVGTSLENSVEIADKVRMTLDGYSGTLTIGGENIKVESVFLVNNTVGFYVPLGGVEQAPSYIIHEYDVTHLETIPIF